MDNNARTVGKALVRHGVLIMLFGAFVAGMGYEVSIVDTFDEAHKAQWKTAHIGTCMQSLLLLAAAAVCSLLDLGPSEWSVYRLAVVLTGWGNSLGYTVGAFVGHRGLTPVCGTMESPIILSICESGPPLNVFVNGLFVIAMVAIIPALGLMFIGACRDRATGKKTK